MTTNDPFREASRFNTARRREEKRHAEAVLREQANHHERMEELRANLTREAAALVLAAERARESALRAILPNEMETENIDISDHDDPEPSLSPNLLKPVDPVPTGGIVEVAEKQKGARR
jgi:hypothetical protein